MFVILRSIFWLTLAYLIIKPGIELPDAGALASQALNSGKQAVVEQVSAIQCTSLECMGSRAMATAVLQADTPRVAATEVQAVATTVPYPRPRPSR
jgi:hypothetical protein